MAEHTENLNHNSVYRFLKFSKISPKNLWKAVEKDIVFSAFGCFIFDDTVLDKNYSFDIELVRKQYSGNTHSVIKGIGVVNCLYYNPELNQYWVIDFRIYDPDTDGKTKLDHVSDMLDVSLIRKIPFRFVLMDTWYATRELMLKINSIGKVFYCPIKSNRKVNDSDGKEPYRYAKDVEWSDTDQQEGKTVKLWGFPKDKLLKLFRIFVSPDRTDFIVTNDLTQNNTKEVDSISSFRWKIEEFHREEKQLTGLESCQCIINRSQRNHIACAILVWNRLKNLAYQIGKTVYQIKNGLLNEYMKAELKNPSIKFART